MSDCGGTKPDTSDTSSIDRGIPLTKGKRGLCGNKAEFKRRVMDGFGTEGWERFVALREGMVRGGTERDVAWGEAIAAWTDGVTGEVRPPPGPTVPGVEGGDVRPAAVETATSVASVADLPGGDGIGHEDAIQWVFEHLDVDAATASSLECPSRGTLALWNYARAGAANRTAFYGMWFKVQERRGKQGADRLKDDGRSVIELIERVKAGIAAEELAAVVADGGHSETGGDAW